MDRGRFIRIAHLSALLFLLSPFSNIYPKNSGGRLVIVAAVKHKQFQGLYDYLKKNAKNFDPRYAGSLRTNGSRSDAHKNLHITLATTNPGAKNEDACKKALGAISEYLKNKISINFDPTHIGFDKDKHVIISLKKDGGYNQLVKLQKKAVQSLKKHGATGIHSNAPNHVTVGFADSLSSKSYPHTIQSRSVTHARVYLWKGHGAQAHPPREEFYPKKEVRIYGGNKHNKNIKNKTNKKNKSFKKSKTYKAHQN